MEHCYNMYSIYCGVRARTQIIFIYAHSELPSDFILEEE